MSNALQVVSARRQQKKKKCDPSIRRFRNKTRNYQLNGGRFDPGTNPPNVTYQPWYPLTLVLIAKDSLVGKSQLIAEHLRSQLDPTGHAFVVKPNNTPTDPFVIQFRIQTIRAWNMTGRTIGLAIEDYGDSSVDNDGRDQICGLIDTGTSLHIPAVGYELPLNLRHTVLRNDDKHKDLYLFDVTGNGSLMIYVSILWRMDGPLQLPKFYTDFDELLHRTESIQRTNHAIQENTYGTLEACKDIVEHTKGSLVSTVVDGAAVVAPYVVPVAGTSNDINTRLLEQILDVLKIDSQSVESSIEVLESNTH